MFKLPMLNVHNGLDRYEHSFLCTLVFRAGFTCSFLLYGARQIFYRYALSCVKFYRFWFLNFRQRNTSDELVVDFEVLCTILAYSLNMTNFNTFYQFFEQRCRWFIHLHKLANCGYEVVLVLLPL